MRYGVIDTAESLLATFSPTTEPLTLDEVKLQRRFTSTSLDALFSLWIAAARQQFEEQTGVQVIEATWEYWLDAFPSGWWAKGQAIELPHPPLREVVSVKYDDADGTEQTVDPSAYRVITPSGPYAQRGVVVPILGGSWPIAAYQPKAVRIQFTAGFGTTPEDVPPLVKYALMMLVGHYHKFAEEVQDENRARITQLPIGAASVIDAYKKAAVQTIVPRYGYGAGVWA